MGNIKKQGKYFGCCFKCTKETGRSVTCHSTCERYLKDKVEMNKTMEVVKREKHLTFDARKVARKER